MSLVELGVRLALLFFGQHLFECHAHNITHNGSPTLALRNAAFALHIVAPHRPLFISSAAAGDKIIAIDNHRDVARHCKSLLSQPPSYFCRPKVKFKCVAKKVQTSGLLENK